MKGMLDQMIKAKNKRSASQLKENTENVVMVAPSPPLIVISEPPKVRPK